MGSGASDRDRDGERDLGSYRVLFELATDGMGAVQLARHSGAAGFERLVVVKRLHAHLAASREVADMFLDEARLASQIRHPHVVPVDDVVDRGGEIFLVQPYIESVTLAALLEAAKAAGERLAPALVARVLLDALAGLDGAHHAADLRGAPMEIVHRDVSPSNLLVGVDGRSRVIDFGIAKAARRITVTKSGTLKGKVPYMAPEQLRRQPVDARADVYAAGVVLYEALTGARPFDGEDEGDTLLSILLGDPPPPTTLAPSLSATIDAVVLRALASARDERFASAAELAEALERALPPASPRDVALTVERLASARLAALREQVRAALDVAPKGAGRAPERDAPAATTTVDPERRSGGRGPRGAARIAVAALALALAGIALALLPHLRAERADADADLARSGRVIALAAPPVSASASEIPSAAVVAIPSPAGAAPTRPRASAPTRKAAVSASASELHPNPYTAPR